MKALILNNKVVDTASVEFEVHESMTWMDCSDECTASTWEVVDGVLRVMPIVDTRTYSDHRRKAYAALNQFEMQFDDASNSTTTWIDSIQAIKAEYPKP